MKYILNRLGFYKLNQIEIGGYCGLCGKWISYAVLTNEDNGWTICNNH